MKETKTTIPSFSVIVIFVALAMIGGVFVVWLPIKLAPDDTLPSITVSFSMKGSARMVETEVTGKLESMLVKLKGVKHIRSRSDNNHGSVRVLFDRSADMEVARFETAMLVRQLWGTMPESASFPAISMQKIDKDAAMPFMSYSINANASPSHILAYAEDYLKPKLTDIPGVSKVEFSGATHKEWALTYNSELLQTLGIEISELQAAIKDRQARYFLEPGIMASMSQKNDSLNIEDLILSGKSGRIITLDNVASAQHVDAEPSGYYRINGMNSIYMNITSTDDANQILLSREIKDKLQDIEKNRSGKFLINLNYDASERINNELDNIYKRSALTIVILLLFIGIITLNLRYLLMVAISLTINIAIAFLFYYLLGVEIHLYSLAGITISLNLIIDNIIVMTDHITRRHNIKVFTSLLAATLTTIGALSIIFFLDEKSILKLKDFVYVVLINLSVSLFVALFLVPALVKRMKINERKKILPDVVAVIKRYIPKERIERAELKFLYQLYRFRWVVIAIFIFAFGMPIYLLPEKIEGDSMWSKIYNASLGSHIYVEKVKPWVDVVLGGTSRLFAEKVYNGNYYDRDIDEPILHINATLPNGATLKQMNDLISKMELFLSEKDGIRQFHTNVYGARRGGIDVYFKQNYINTGYPYKLESDVISKALTLGGGSWSVYGLENMGFNNDVRESTGSSRIKITGYNYDDLMKYAEEIRDTLLAYNRIKEVALNSEFSWWKDDFTEFYLEIDRHKLAKLGLSINKLYQAITREVGNGLSAGTVMGVNGLESVKLYSSNKGRDVWGFMKIPIKVGNSYYKLEDFATIEKRQAPKNIIREDQEYVLCLQYEYIGSHEQGKKVLNRIVEKFNERFPLGYTAEAINYDNSKEDSSKQYLLIFIVALIVFFITSILFNSLRQPLAIIFVIPVSFIGLFLTFYIFNLKFDQGGFAAFVLLCGITVNAAIYIVNEYNSLRKREPYKSESECYVEAFNFKIRSVLLTVLSTILGFIPFLIGETRLSFWFPLAAGTMGGLIFSMFAIILLLPIFIMKGSAFQSCLDQKTTKS